MLKALFSISVDEHLFQVLTSEKGATYDIEISSDSLRKKARNDWLKISRKALLTFVCFSHFQQKHLDKSDILAANHDT